MEPLTLDELHELEQLLKKGAGVVAGDYPFHGRIDTVWIGDKIDRIDKVDQRKMIDRGRR